MYNLDINFLKDRGLETTTEPTVIQHKSKGGITDKIPIIAGVIIALVFPAISFSYMKSIEAKTAEVEEDIAAMEAEIARLGNQNKQIEAVKAQIQQVETDTKALVGVFDKIRPWSAILQEITDRTPPGVQVASLNQSGSGNNLKIQIGGEAKHYNDVNDFVLFLQRSPFFDRQNIVLGTVSTSSLSIDLENRDQVPEDLELNIPQGVRYTITAQLNNLPASKLIQEIESKGAVGIVTRLKTLESKGVIAK